MWAVAKPLDGSANATELTSKAAIESVLDVDDDDPRGKDRAPCRRFSRSILVLTPQGAFKFNALNAEGHFSWLIALSYVCRSCRDQSCTNK
ncbi:uncharacterized protein ATNIH1004_006855 [Aspergillus tanneri]|uniref:Pleckstrin homology domain-containing protein n=1 Tax=Aspergillus tanneri TaxID=1220188 RepID=A0A5M9MHY9_9EURO|nr:uncharacterized protein ATNIH1004_006855 [Aspergillus tanneri]KAA8645436.1 hypothetical protein ATNIH1004_006855 [Aspergillus tanneri]